LGFWAVLPQAAFAFIGTEIVSIAAGETKNPRRNLPKAIKTVYIRILLFYIGGTIIIGLLVPSDNPQLKLATPGTAASSPFVIAVQQAGINALPKIINACILTAALSAGSSTLFTSSRAIYGLAASGNAPRLFLKTLPNGLPIVAVLFNSCFALLSYIGVRIDSGQTFTYFSQMASIAGLLTWFGISVTYLRFYKGMKIQCIDRTKLPYYHEHQPFLAWYAVCSISFIMLVSGWTVFLRGQFHAPTFVAIYLALVLFPILYLGARMYYREGPKKPLEMDFLTNIDEIEADTYDEPPPRNAAEAFWQWLM
jgi:amino acid transporter